MRVPWVAVPIGQDAEALGAADPVLDRDPEAAEAAVVVLPGLSHLILYGRVCVERSRRGGPNSTTGAENRASDRV